MSVLLNNLRYIDARPFRLVVGKLTIYTGVTWRNNHAKYGYLRTMSTLTNGHRWSVVTFGNILTSSSKLAPETLRSYREEYV
jgi:hypothetical protein